MQSSDFGGSGLEEQINILRQSEPAVFCADPLGAGTALHSLRHLSGGLNEGFHSLWAATEFPLFLCSEKEILPLTSFRARASACDPQSPSVHGLFLGVRKKMKCLKPLSARVNFQRGLCLLERFQWHLQSLSHADSGCQGMGQPLSCGIIGMKLPDICKPS